MNIAELNKILSKQGLSIERVKDQESSQVYEWNACRNDLDNLETVNEYFSLIDRRIYQRSLIYKEFLHGNYFLYKQMEHWLSDKVSLEIGSSWCPQIPIFPARMRVFVEPMANRIDEYVSARYSREIFKDGIKYSCYGDKYIPELRNQIDGLIYVRNCIDHTPNWVFILSNISSYAKSGCTLMIWNDIDHFAAAQLDPGHYNITPSKLDFVRLLENLGFSIEWQFDFHDRMSTNVGIVATKNSTPSHSTLFQYKMSEHDLDRKVEAL
jgi:hypothetical protein